MSNEIDKQRLLIEMVMRQTEYTYEEAEKKLTEYNNNYMNVIRDYMGVKKTEEKQVTSINQHVYKEIRGLMDTAADRYRKQQEMEKKKEELVQRLREEYNRRQKENKLEKIKENTEDQKTELEEITEEENKVI